MKTLIKILYYLFIFAIFILLILTFLSAVGVPKNNRVFVVETGSMQPEIKKGSLIIVRPETSYKIGDIITYKAFSELGGPKELTITHRIKSIKVNEVGDTYFETKGDANDDVDPFQTNQIDVVGKVNFHIPFIGYLIGFAKTGLGFLLLILIPSIIIILLEVKSILSNYNRLDNTKKS